MESSEHDKTSYNKIIGVINQKIKEYRDKTKKDKNELPLFKKSNKQILGYIEKEKQLIALQENKKEEEIFLERFREFIDMNEKRIPIAKSLMNDLVNKKFENEYDGIYLRRESINTISRQWFNDYNSFLFSLPQLSKSKDKESPKLKKFISLEDIKNVILGMDGDIFKSKYYIEDNKDGVIYKNENKWIQFLKIWKYEFDNLFKDKNMKMD